MSFQMPNEPQALRNAESLVGHILPNGWKITEKLLTATPGSSGAEHLTGSNFSVGYKGQKKHVFLKVFDFEKLLIKSRIDPSISFMKKMDQLTSEFEFECSILKECMSGKMDRIVHLLDQGDYMIEGSLIPIP
jgi:hypothetical protein